MRTLNATAIGVGNTEEEAYSDWSDKCGNPREIIPLVAK